MFWILLAFVVLLILLVIGLKYFFNYVAESGLDKAKATESQNSLLKKFSHIRLEKFTALFFNIGLSFSLAFVLWSFEYKTFDGNEIVSLGEVEDNFEEIQEMPLTDIPPPPPPKMEIPQIVEVPDEEEIEEEIEMNLDVEVNEETVIEELVFDEAPEEEAVDEIFTIVENQPEPPGGMQGFLKYVGEEMEYPKTAKRMGIQGRVFVQFIVDQNGNLTDVKAIKGIGGGCDEEAERVIREAPKWTPGKQRGRPVKVKMVLPVTFKLR